MAGRKCPSLFDAHGCSARAWKRLIIASRLAIGRGVVGCSKQLFTLKETAKHREEFADKLWSIVYQDDGRYAIRYDSMA